jgi:hypothetical protein
MPIAASVSGTLTRIAAGGSPALGTLSVIGYATNPALGTLSVDRTVFLAFYARVRLNRADLYIDDELMLNLVDTVELDSSLADPIDYATFTLSDKRSAYFDPATVSRGSAPVSIDLWAGPPGSVLNWQNAFVGNMETSTNTMPYRPRGVFKAVSLAALWANLLGCLQVPAMSGMTRGAVLAAFFESAGVALSNAGTLGGGIVTKPVDISGVTPFQLVQDFGEIEGWFARATDDGTGLEVISEDHILDGAPVFAFDESNTFDMPETTPDRPVTDWILSTTQITTDPPIPMTGGAAASGSTVTTSGGGSAPAAPPMPPTLLTSTGGSPTITGSGTAWTTSVSASSATFSIVFVDGKPDFAATWVGTVLTPSSAPIGSIRVLYWS